MLPIIGYSFKHHIPRKIPQTTELGERKIDKLLHNFREKINREQHLNLKFSLVLGLILPVLAFISTSKNTW